MGLFGLGKKKDDPLSSIGTGGIPDLNAQMNSPSGSMQQGFGQNQGYNDPFMDPNSGLKLNDLNSSQDLGLGSSSGMDSFGNLKPQPRGEFYDSRSQPLSTSSDTARDLQLILAKLDAIRSEITNINHRLDNIERHQQETPQKKYPW